jgi:hypothetical protein
LDTGKPYSDGKNNDDEGHKPQISHSDLFFAREGWKSYDTDGRPIGLFDSEELAAKAVYKRAALPSPRLNA